VKRPESAPFDVAAASYDAEFSDRVVPRAMRELVWERLATVFSAGQKILELGCGTGEDAVWLAGRGLRVHATDQSAAMLAVASAKAEQAGVADRVSFARLDLAGIADAPVPAGAPFDGALADFGVLNCLADRRPLARRLAGWLRSGAPVVVVVMGRWCLLEMLGYALRLRPGKAMRRLRDGRAVGVGGGRAVPTSYIGWRRLRRDFADDYVLRERRAIGLALPPPDFGALVEGQPRRLARLMRWERRLAPFLPGFGDHVLVVLERRP